LFLGQGGHVRADVPRLVEAARVAHPAVAIELAASAGEDDGVVAALAGYAMR
jgi:sirohydrochlorin cobaltochelatase